MTEHFISKCAVRDQIDGDSRRDFTVDVKGSRKGTTAARQGAHGQVYQQNHNGKSSSRLGAVNGVVGGGLFQTFRRLPIQEV